MSQRCLLSLRKNVTKEDHSYDCIYDENGSLQLLLDDWLCLKEDSGCYLGGWKLNIRDTSLFANFKNDFAEIKKHCPMLSSMDDVTIRIDGILLFTE